MEAAHPCRHFQRHGMRRDIRRGVEMLHAPSRIFAGARRVALCAVDGASIRATRYRAIWVHGAFGTLEIFGTQEIGVK